MNQTWNRAPSTSTRAWTLTLSILCGLLWAPPTSVYGLRVQIRARTQVSAAIRADGQRWFLHGRVVDPSSEQVALVLDLLVEAYAVPDDQYGCFQRRDPRQFAELKEAAEQAGVLLPANRYISPEDRANAYAWQLVLDFMISHYDYITE